MTDIERVKLEIALWTTIYRALLMFATAAKEYRDALAVRVKTNEIAN